MKFFRSKKVFVSFIIICIALQIYNVFPLTLTNIDHKSDIFPIYPQAINRTGKTFNNITRISKNCYINREFPGLNSQPDVFIPNYNISYAKMTFENITALNYTRNIERDFSEFIISSQNGPTYVYQKFAVEINQFVNNVTILIQDLNNPTLFTDENSWEVAIVNCLNDTNGTPNPTETIGLLQKPHPISFATHWEIFDFKNDGLGPIFLDTSTTNMTTEGGINKFWFKQVKNAPNDTRKQ